MSVGDKKCNLSHLSQDHIPDLLQSAKTDRGVFAKLLTEIDRQGVNILRYKPLLEPPRLALRVGVTGCMGVGKSVLINGLVNVLAQQPQAKNWKVGILAVDPTSPINKGAILGDRIRLSALPSRFFFRSIGSRGSVGGVCGQAYLMLRAFDWAEFDLVFIETVGVGQTEWEVMHVADHVALVLGPENGDGIQLMKSGLMEIADLFLINKSDQPGANWLKKHLKGDVIMDKQKPIFATVATSGQGLEDVVEYLVKLKQEGHYLKQRWSQDRLQAEARACLHLKSEEAFLPSILKIRYCKDLQKFVCD